MKTVLYEPLKLPVIIPISRTEKDVIRKLFKIAFLQKVKLLPLLLPLQKFSKESPKAPNVVTESVIEVLVKQLIPTQIHKVNYKLILGVVFYKMHFVTGIPICLEEMIVLSGHLRSNKAPFIMQKKNRSCYRVFSFCFSLIKTNKMMNMKLLVNEIVLLDLVFYFKNIFNNIIIIIIKFEKLSINEIILFSIKNKPRRNSIFELFIFYFLLYTFLYLYTYLYRSISSFIYNTMYCINALK